MTNCDLLYTVGPASLGRERELLSLGATGGRLTFSYGTPALQHERASVLKQAAAALGRTCHILADLAGEKYRLGVFGDRPSVLIHAGQVVRLVAADPTPYGPEPALPVADRAVLGHARPGDTIVVGDGGVELAVGRVSPEEISCEAMADGVVEQCRGLMIRVRCSGRGP